jgi:hypothetical protein
MLTFGSWNSFMNAYESFHDIDLLIKHANTFS